MKKLLFIFTVLVIFSSSLISQTINPLYEKKQFSFNFSPTLGISNDAHNNIYGITAGIGYNVFKKTEIGFNISYLNFRTNSYYGTTLFFKYYLLNTRFTPFIEFDNNFSNIYSLDKFTYNPAIGLGLGYYAFGKKLGIEFGMFYVHPNRIAPKLSFKWYF